MATNLTIGTTIVVPVVTVLFILISDR